MQVRTINEQPQILRTDAQIVETRWSGCTQHFKAKPFEPQMHCCIITELSATLINFLNAWIASKESLFLSLAKRKFKLAGNQKHMVVCHQIEMGLVSLLAGLPVRLPSRLPVWLLAMCKAVINHDQYREMVVGFPNPLAPGIQMQVSWGTRKWHNSKRKIQILIERRE